MGATGPAPNSASFIIKAPISLTQKRPLWPPMCKASVDCVRYLSTKDHSRLLRILPHRATIPHAISVCSCLRTLLDANAGAACGCFLQALWPPMCKASVDCIRYLSSKDPSGLLRILPHRAAIPHAISVCSCLRTLLDANAGAAC